MIESITIRPFIKEDWTSVSKIYAEGIATGIATFETEVPTWKQWHKKFIETCRLVAIHKNEVVGFAMLSLVSKREVYKGVAEVSIYITSQQQGKGVGKVLLEALINASETHEFWTLQAGIFTENEASIALHQACGFRRIGKREKIGQLYGQWKDNILLERRSKKINYK